MAYANPNSLVSTEWLAQHLNAPDVRVVDASWYMAHLGRDPKAEFNAEHIPGAVYFDIDDIADTDSDLPHMLPSAEKFSSRCRRLGLGDGVRIVVYDGGGCTAAARAWWMFRTFGHDDVSVLDGGLPKWKAEGRALADLPDLPRERHMSSRFNTMMVRSVDQMLENVKRNREQVLDARSQGRFAGTDPEPREGLRGGHIPNSLCLPFTQLFDSDGTFKSGDEIRALFDGVGINMKAPVTTTCGSGVTACVLALGLHLIGHRQVAVYDGSWTEWGGREDTPISR